MLKAWHGIRYRLSGQAMNSSGNKSFARRMKLVLWKQDQVYLAILLVGCFLGMCSYFWFYSTKTGGVIDIDRAASRETEFRVDINAADWPEIVVLPGVGEKLARAIVAHREETGPFQTLESIQDVVGIGEGKFAQIRPFLLPIKNRNQ